MKIRSLSLLATTLSLACLPVCANTISFSADTTNLLPFNRPTEDGSVLSDVGMSVHYFVKNFTVNLTGSYNFSAVAKDPANFDTFIQLYSMFDYTQPLNNYLAGNDDAGANANLGSALTGIALTAGSNYSFVIDGFGDSDWGAFSASITGPGSISSVPDESSTFALAACGIAGLWLVRRRSVANS